MRREKIIFLSVVILVMIFTFAFAAGDAERGKVLFNDPKFAGGTKSCNSCHPNGKGLEKTADKKEFAIMGGKQKSHEEAVNFCIVNFNKGKAIDIKSPQMQDMVAYIKFLKAK